MDVAGKLIFPDRQKIDRVLKDFPHLTDKHKQLVLGAALRLAEVQGPAASPQGLKGQGAVHGSHHCANNAPFK
jgi:hypothetical protein